MILGRLGDRNVVANHPLKDKCKFKIMEDRMATNPYFLGIRDFGALDELRLVLRLHTTLFYPLRGLNALKSWGVNMDLAWNLSHWI